MSTNARTGAIFIASATIVFIAALALFCIALGLDFENEGWSGDGLQAAVSWNQPQMILVTIGFVISIVLFFMGVQRVSKAS